jgi:hypothetical protein
MARFSTLYYFFAVLAVLAVLAQAAPVQQQDEGLPMGLDGLMGGKNNANPASPSAQQEEDPNKMFDVGPTLFFFSFLIPYQKILYMVLTP